VPLALALALNDFRTRAVPAWSSGPSSFCLHPGRVVAGLIWRYMYDGNTEWCRGLSLVWPGSLPGTGYAGLGTGRCWCGGLEVLRLSHGLFVAGTGIGDEVLEAAKIDGANRCRPHGASSCPCAPSGGAFALLQYPGFIRHSLFCRVNRRGAIQSTNWQSPYLYNFGINGCEWDLAAQSGMSLFRDLRV